MEQETLRAPHCAVGVLGGREANRLGIHQGVSLHLGFKAY